MKPLPTLAALLLAVAAATAPVLAADAPLQGEVLETKDVDSYTYLRLATPSGETWAAVPTVKLKKGDKVTVANPMVMHNFQSKSLGKTFDKIVFGFVAGPAGAAGAAPAAPAAKAAAPHGATPPAAAAPASAPVKVAKATGADARTVGEIFAQRKALKDKPVTLRAQVVKVSNGIMGKNWLHLRDGTGSAADHSDDLVVTTQAEAKVGEVVLVKGTVRADVDVGAGYTFSAMIENGALSR